MIHCPRTFSEDAAGQQVPSLGCFFTTTKRHSRDRHSGRVRSDSKKQKSRGLPECCTTADLETPVRTAS